VLVPVVLPLKLAVQTPALLPLLVRVQLDGPETTPVGFKEKVTVPEGFDFWLLPVSVTVTSQLLDAPIAIVVGLQAMAVVVVRDPAATSYGPMNGPPPGAPMGVTPLVEVSESALAMFKRPFPVSSAVPAGSAFRARRLSMTAFEAEGSFAINRAAAPATFAAAAEVPVIVITPSPNMSAGTSTPGAPMKVSTPELLEAQRLSF
jgi:hypothetical protein